ncbi:MAG: hypothetical protein AAF799_23585 [Myxococcota bacterium]
MNAFYVRDPFGYGCLLAPTGHTPPSADALEPMRGKVAAWVIRRCSLDESALARFLAEEAPRSRHLGAEGDDALGRLTQWLEADDGSPFTLWRHRAERPIADTFEVDAVPLTDLAEPLVTESEEDEAPTEVRVRLEITEIRGLYRPGFDDGTRGDENHRIGCGYEPGYTSADDLGRIFVNHRPRPDASAPWADARERDTQYVEIHVAVTAAREGEELPAGLELQWTWEDPGPCRPLMRNGAEHEIEPDDNRSPLMQDNRGSCDFPSPASGRDAAWEQIDHALSPGADARECRTQVVDGLTTARLHCTNAGGDNYRVRVELVPHASATGSAPVRTGIMTMWKRIDVEYHEMIGMPSLPVARAVPIFETAHVQMDFTDPIESPQQEHITSAADYQPDADAYVQDRFRHHGQRGWFFLSSADKLTSHASDNPFRQVWPAEQDTFGPAVMRLTDDGRGRQIDVLVVDTPIGSGRDFPTGVKIRVPGDGTRSGFYRIESAYENWPSRGKTSLVLAGTSYYSDFVPNDGRNDRHGPVVDYYPRFHRDQDGPRLLQGGMGFTRRVEARIGAGASDIAFAGLSTAAPDNDDYFAGRALVFTHYTTGDDRAYSEDEALHTMVHELTHGFGIPHQCGYAANEGSDTACAMSYQMNWLYRPGTRRVRPFAPGQRSAHLCPRHIDTLRRTCLEDNPAMWTW